VLKRGLNSYRGRTVVIHQNGPSIQGVLTGVHKDCLILRGATDLDAKADLGGEIVIPRAQGVWWQVPDTESA
jgi:hypothetical protein